MPRTLGQAAAFLLGFALALWLSPLALRVARADPAEAPFAELEAQLLEGVNAVRARKHMIPLVRDPALDAVARAHSEDMARRRFLDHRSPEGDDPLDRLSRAGVEGFTLAAENIGSTNRADPNREILEGWIQSPIHRRNLFTPPFNTTGIGIATAADGTLVYTQVYVSYPR